MLEPKVFKAYDIRGIYPTELDEEGAHAIGRAYVEQFEPKEIAVGRDMRVSSPSMAKALIEGATAAGANVVDIGLVGTEMLYFAVGHLELDGGIQVTASHNPKEYIGMKIVRRGAMPVGGDSGLLDIRDRALSAFRHVRGTGPRTGPGGGCLSGLRRQGPVLRRPGRGRAAAGRDRRGERDGRRDAASRPRADPDRRGALLLRAGRHLPEPRAEPAAAREPRVRDRQGARGRGRARRGLRRRRRPLLLHRRHRRVRPRRLRHRPPRRVDAGEVPGRQDHLRRPRELGRPGDDRARRAASR